MTDERRSAGFKDRTRLAAACDVLLDAASPVDRTETVSVVDADGRVTAEAVSAPRPVPHYQRAAMDGFAVRASETFDATDRSPATLGLADEVGPGTARRVHTGSELPAGADAVVMVEHADEQGDRLEVFDPVAEGENVAPVGEDVTAGAELVDRGHQLRPSDLGLLKAVGLEEVAVFERPVVDVIPTGEELVQADPDPGEVVETNGLTTTRYVQRWGGVARYRDVVTDDRAALRAAIERGLDADVVVTTGGSSVGERDFVPDVAAELGDVREHGVAIKPGHPVAIGVVEETPLVMLPGYPVSCIVTAVQLLRPLVYRLRRLTTPDHPSTDVRLSRKVAGEPGVRSFVRVRLEHDDEVTAVPVRAGGAGVLSSVSRADGWVTIPERREGLPEGEQVAVEDWDPPA